MGAVNMHRSRTLSEGSESADKYIEGSELSNNQICELFDSTYRITREPNETRNDYYCGITNNIAQNQSRHGVPHLICVKCKDAETSAGIETMLQNMGFNIGEPRYKGNGGVDDSIFVYMCHKTEGFKK